jgi:hypothetical protein
MSDFRIAEEEGGMNDKYKDNRISRTTSLGYK